MPTPKEAAYTRYSPRFERAARIVSEGGLIAYPTEAVYGIGCLPGERGAIERLLRIKQRSWRKNWVCKCQWVRFRLKWK